MEHIFQQLVLMHHHRHCPLLSNSNFLCAACGGFLRYPTHVPMVTTVPVIKTDIGTVAEEVKIRSQRNHGSFFF